MEKEIRLPYKEYKEMLDLIEGQQKVIEKIKEEKGTIVIDSRDGYYRNYEFKHLANSIPKIIGEDDANKFLKEDFNNLHARVEEMSRRFDSWKHERDMEKLKREVKKKWWQ